MEGSLKSSNRILPEQKHRHNHGRGIQITETHVDKSNEGRKPNVPSEYMMSSMGGIITTDNKDTSFILLHPKRKDNFYDPNFTLASAPSLHGHASSIKKQLTSAIIHILVSLIYSKKMEVLHFNKK